MRITEKGIEWIFALFGTKLRHTERQKNNKWGKSFSTVEEIKKVRRSIDFFFLLGVSILLRNISSDVPWQSWELTSQYLQLRRGAGEHPNPNYFSTSHRRFNIFFFFYSFCFEDRRKGNKKVIEGKGKIFKGKEMKATLQKTCTRETFSGINLFVIFLFSSMRSVGIS